MTSTLIADPNPLIRVEQSRKLHDRLVECDVALRELEENPSRYSVATFNLIFQAITTLREQTRAEIEELQG